MNSPNKLYRTSLITGILAFTAIQANAAPITIDGDLSDWGINVIDGGNTALGGSDYSGLRTDLAGSMIEDTNDAKNNYFLGPNSGGQNYDGEFMGALVDNSTLYLSILTGQRPDNGFSNNNNHKGLYSPGDIRIETSMGTFGIEVGGGAVAEGGNALTEGDNGTTYTIDSNGYTTGSSDSSIQTVGSVWKDVTWIDGISTPQAVQFDINPGSTKVGDADFIFTRNSVTNQHAIIELALNTNIFGGATLTDVYWLPSCGNDELHVTTDINTVPEPAALGLMALGLLGMGAMRRRRS